MILTTLEDLGRLLEKMNKLEDYLKRQEDQTLRFKEANPSFPNYQDLLVAQCKATRTSFELMRDEIEELGYLISYKAEKDK
jgi:hypothetical protein